MLKQKLKYAGPKIASMAFFMRSTTMIRYFSGKGYSMPGYATSWTIPVVFLLSVSILKDNGFAPLAKRWVRALMPAPEAGFSTSGPPVTAMSTRPSAARSVLD